MPFVGNWPFLYCGCLRTDLRIRPPTNDGQEVPVESVSDIKANEVKAAERERSLIDFSYTDLDNAVEVVRSVHNAGGTACDYDQLAAELGVEAKGGGFRLRVNGAKTFGLINYERGGRISLTDIGLRIIDPQTERQARVDAFLAVALHQRVYEQFKGGPLPPQAGLERAIESMGVGAKVKDRARQVLLRSAKQAGFFELASDRLVKPSIREAPGKAPLPPDPPPGERQQGRTGGGGGGGSDHPLIQGLLMTLPKPGEEWSYADRYNWLNMANSIFKMVYKAVEPDANVEVTLTQKQQ